MSGMRRQPRIMHVVHFSMLREKVCNFHCIFRMRAHPPGEGAHSAQDQPAIERRGDSPTRIDRKSTRLNSSHVSISYAVFCLKKKKKSTEYYTRVVRSNTHPSHLIADERTT